MKKKSLIIIAIIALLIIIFLGLIYILKLKPLNEAKKEYNDAYVIINNKNKQLDSEISQLQNIIDSGEKPIDEALIDLSKEAIKEAQKNKFLLGEMPKSVKDIKNKTEELKNSKVDYSSDISKMQDAGKKLTESITAYKKFIKPTAEYIISKLANVDEIKNSKAVTEDNDPNGKLNKSGGYTATVYFESSNVDPNEVEGKDVIEKGTDGGGSIEVYANEDDANKRRDYLASFDGTILSNGSHRVIGTTLIRTSDKLTATQQKNLEKKIIEAMSN